MTSVFSLSRRSNRSGVSALVRSVAVGLSVVSFAGVGGVFVPAASAQDVGERTNEDRLNDFIHFVIIGRFDVARDLAREMLASGITPTEFVDLVDGSGEADRFRRAVDRASGSPILNDLAGVLDELYRQGRLERARNPEEVAKNIEGLMANNQLARALARERLIEAGEYAMPLLLEAFLQRGDATLRVRVRNVMQAMGRQAVMPLSIAVERLDPVRQELVVSLLGDLRYRQSVPFLLELANTTSNEAVRNAVRQAITTLGASPDADAAEMFGALAEGYYDERDELTSFPSETHQLFWTYDPGLGLLPTPLRTEIYHEAMSMRLAEKSLRLDSGSSSTVALWIAANMSRELDTPEGYSNPAYGDDRRPAEYFAVAAGPRISQLVLGRAIGDLDTPLARRAIAAVERTAGADSLVTLDEGTSPLVQALDYAGRRVRFDAALALARSQPAADFARSSFVVPTLAAAIRTAGDRYAIVMTGSDREEYAYIRGLLEGRGFDVLPPADRGLVDLGAAIVEAPGIDLIVTSLPEQETRDIIDDVRGDARLAASPVLALARPGEDSTLDRLFGRERLVAVRERVGLLDSEILAAADQLVLAASGTPIDADEAGFYATRSIAALRDLAVANNRVLRVNDAAPALIAALAEAEREIRLSIAEVLSYIDENRAQAAIADAAIDARGAEQVAMLGAVAESAKRYGNLLDLRLVRGLIELASAPDQDVATAAAAAVGALELDDSEIVPLILGEAVGRGGSGIADRR